MVARHAENFQEIWPADGSLIKSVRQLRDWLHHLTKRQYCADRLMRVQSSLCPASILMFLDHGFQFGHYLLMRDQIAAIRSIDALMS